MRVLPGVPGLLLLAVLLPWQPAAAHGWATVSSPEFVSCLSRVECQGETPCLNIEFDLAPDSCSTYCIGSGMFPCAASSDADPEWIVDGTTEVQIPDVPPGGRLAAEGELVTPDLFVVSGEFSGHHSYLGTADLAVFRYSGDPLAFEGLDIRSLSDLIDLGLIGPADVLFQETFDEKVYGFSFDVDVSGIDPGEIVLFTSGVGIGAPDAPDEPVPAMSGVRSLGLFLVMLVAGTLFLLRR